ncbi:MAG: hypothetical protein IPK83_22220 [Planctomycetes bacterium]|nr:hypothetical protein [Planctomycetota bacterium]
MYVTHDLLKQPLGLVIWVLDTGNALLMARLALEVIGGAWAGRVYPAIAAMTDGVVMGLHRRAALCWPGISQKTTGVALLIASHFVRNILVGALLRSM